MAQRKGLGGWWDKPDLAFYKTLGLMSVCLIILDQLTKFLIREFSEEGMALFMLGPFVSITYVQNNGAAFSMLRGANDLLIWLSVIAIGLMLYVWNEFPDNRLARMFQAFILSGAVGNMLDRIFLGYVTDFVDVGFWPVFNVADSLITVGLVGLVACIAVDRSRSENRKTKKK